MAAHDFTNAKAPLSKVVTLDGTQETVLPPHGTRSVSWRFVAAAGTAAAGGGDSVDFDADVWYTEAIRADQEGPCEVGQVLPIAWEGTLNEDLQLFFSRRGGG